MHEQKKKRKTSKTSSHAAEPGRRAVRLTSGLLAAAFLPATLLGTLPTPARAATYEAAGAFTPAQRVVQGRVVDKSDAPITGAVVYLKDTRSLSVKSYLTDDAGHFHFGQLADGADYEVWAEQSGKRSSSKSISQFNGKLDIQFTLKIDRGE